MSVSLPERTTPSDSGEVPDFVNRSKVVLLSPPFYDTRLCIIYWTKSEQKRPFTPDLWFKTFNLLLLYGCQSALWFGFICRHWRIHQAVHLPGQRGSPCVHRRKAAEAEID